MAWARVYALTLALVAASTRTAAAEPAGAGESAADSKVRTEGDAGGPRGDEPASQDEAQAGIDAAGPGQGTDEPRDGEGHTGGGAGSAPGGAGELHAAQAPVAGEVSARRRAAAIAVAIFPGVLVRGAGSWVVGDHRAGKRLAVAGAIGFAAVVAGGAPIGLSGSSPYTIWPGVPLVVSGAGLGLSSWLADIWVAAGGARLRSTPLALPPWSVEVATTWLHDAYRERALLGGAGHLELGRLGFDMSGYVDARNAARSGEAGAHWRLWGPAGTVPEGGAVADGSRLVVRSAARLDRDDEDGVTLATAEVELSGRLDLDRLDPAIRGNFVELSVGAGLTRTTYPGNVHDNAAILLAGFAWGAYLGDRGELRLFYDHRRDGLAGGLDASHAAGFVGSFGASADLRVTGPWAVHGQLQIGNAWVTTLGVRYLGRYLGGPGDASPSSP